MGRLQLKEERGRDRKRRRRRIGKRGSRRGGGREREEVDEGGKGGREIKGVKMDEEKLDAKMLYRISRN